MSTLESGELGYTRYRWHLPQCHNTLPWRPCPKSRGPLRPLQVAVLVCQLLAMAPALWPALEVHTGSADPLLQAARRPHTHHAHTTVSPVCRPTCDRPRGEPPIAHARLEGEQRVARTCPCALAPLETAEHSGPCRWVALMSGTSCGISDDVHMKKIF